MRSGRRDRLMRLQALKARLRRRRLPPDLSGRQAGAVAPNVLIKPLKPPLQTANGSRRHLAPRGRLVDGRSDDGTWQ